MLLAFLATAGLFYVNIMSAIVAGVADGLGVTQQQAGWVGSANVYGAALGALAAVFIVRRAPWRPFAVVSLLALISIDIASTFITSINLLTGVRFVHGLIGGMLVGWRLAWFRARDRLTACSACCFSCNSVWAGSA